MRHRYGNELSVVQWKQGGVGPLGPRHCFASRSEYGTALEVGLLVWNDDVHPPPHWMLDLNPAATACIDVRPGDARLQTHFGVCSSPTTVIGVVCSLPRRPVLDQSQLAGPDGRRLGPWSWHLVTQESRHLLGAQSPLAVSSQADYRTALAFYI